jgi:hypothetical protein
MFSLWLLFHLVLEAGEYCPQNELGRIPSFLNFFNRLRRIGISYSLKV